MVLVVLRLRSEAAVLTELSMIGGIQNICELFF